MTTDPMTITQHPPNQYPTIRSVLFSLLAPLLTVSLVNLLVRHCLNELQVKPDDCEVLNNCLVPECLY